MSTHALEHPDISAAIQAAAAYPVQAILAVHFSRTYAVHEVDEALDAADNVEVALDGGGLVVIDGDELDALQALRTTAETILKLRKAGIPARDTRWKIAWRELEEQTK